MRTKIKTLLVTMTACLLGFTGCSSAIKEGTIVDKEYRPSLYEYVMIGRHAVIVTKRVLIFVLIPHLPFYQFGYSFPSENATLNYTKKRTETGRWFQKNISMYLSQHIISLLKMK